MHKKKQDSKYLQGRLLLWPAAVRSSLRRQECVTTNVGVSPCPCPISVESGIFGSSRFVTKDAGKTKPPVQERRGDCNDALRSPGPSSQPCGEANAAITLQRPGRRMTRLCKF
ncbi:hypothetical protein VTK56DRAFT_4429 [Thermocarpiscus australiensis]